MLCKNKQKTDDKIVQIVGSSGLVINFRPVLVGLKDVFNIDAMVIDPYFGQNAVTAGVEEVFGKGFGDAMILLLIAFIVNILLVRFSKYTKLRELFTTGHVQVQQAATAYWLIMFALPGLITHNVALIIVMAVILGAYWAVGANILIKLCFEENREFLHSIYGGSLCGKPVFVTGHRKGERDLMAFFYNHYVKDGKDIIISTNREIDEVALYTITEN